ncbi:MAG: hypothetical protein HY721_13155 [Planctomycetes bacterium]|nr:hypothetical protein [Planctomycetota bacterium]
MSLRTLLASLRTILVPGIAACLASSSSPKAARSQDAACALPGLLLEVGADLVERIRGAEDLELIQVWKVGAVEELEGERCRLELYWAGRSLEGPGAGGPWVLTRVIAGTAVSAALEAAAGGKARIAIGPYAVEGLYQSAADRSLSTRVLLRASGSEWSLDAAARSFAGEASVDLLERDGAPLAEARSLPAQGDYVPGPPLGPGQVPGDCNQDARLDISDAVCVLGFLFLGSPRALPCGDGSAGDGPSVELLDCNGDGRVDISDGICHETRVRRSIAESS